MGPNSAASALDGIRRHNVFRRLPKYNAVVKIGIAEADVLAGLSHSRRMIAATAGGLLAALAALGGLLLGLFGGRLRSILGRDGEGRFSTLFDAATPVMLVIDPASGAIVEANRSAARFYGYDQAMLKGMRITEINLQMENATLKAMGDADSAGCSRFLFRHRLADGQLREVEVYTGPVEVKGGRLLLSVIHDITERLRQDADRLRVTRAVEQCPLPVIITDPEGTIEYVNQAFTAGTGYSAEEILGQNPRLLKSGETAAADYIAMWAELAAGNVWRGQFHNRRKDGTLFWEQALISPVTDDHGRITHYLGVKDAVPARRDMESEVSS